MSDNKLPTVIAIDCENYCAFNKNGAQQPWHIWHPRWKHYFPIYKLGDPNKQGMFVRTIQATRSDGDVIIFDLFMYPPNQDLLPEFRKLLENQTIIGFNYHCDRKALLNTYKELRMHSAAADTYRIWNDLQAENNRVLNADPYLYSKMDPTQGIPFYSDNVRPSLGDIMYHLFEVDLNKSDHQIMGQDLNQPLYRIEVAHPGFLQYAAADAVAYFDTYMALDLH